MSKSTRKSGAKAKSAPAGAEKPQTPAGQDAATVNRRGSKDRRSTTDRREKCQPVAVERRTIERRAKVNRRRQIDPTTCERDYSLEEIEFMSALEEYKRTSGRMFPTCSEILEVLSKLGYQKRQGEPSLGPPPSQAQESPPADPPHLWAADELQPSLVPDP